MTTLDPGPASVTLVGVGVIGRGWIRVFTGAGRRVRLYDHESVQLDKALAWLDGSLEAEVSQGALDQDSAEEQRGLVSAHPDLAEALGESVYVQESGPEKIEIKREIFARMDSLTGPEAILASSTSSLDMNEIARGLPGSSRCLMAHPFNPPHVIPVVEVMPTEWTAGEVTERAVRFLTAVGQKPVLMKRFAVGYLLNRIQAAVVREAVHMVATGLAEAADVDTVIRDGLALRWALLGNFGTNNTNADGGIREYYTRYGGVYQTIMADLDPTPPSFDPELIERIGRQVDAMEGGAPVSELCRWRDRMVLKLRALKEADPHP